MIAFLFGAAAGFAVGFIFFRSTRAYEEGFKDGDRYGYGEGYRKAWLKASEPLLNARTGDWNRPERKRAGQQS